MKKNIKKDASQILNDELSSRMEHIAEMAVIYGYSACLGGVPSEEARVRFLKAFRKGYWKKV